jgi:hypothetical protein
MKQSRADASIAAEGRNIMHRSFIAIAAALASAAVPAIAHAAPAASGTVRLTEVSADPRDGADTVALRNLGAFTHLELRAREALVDLHAIGLRMRDGRVEWLDARARIAPGQQRTIELPYKARRADAIVLDYGDPADRRRDRTPARLEIYGASPDDCDDDLGQGRGRGTVSYLERARLEPVRDARDARAPYLRAGRRTPPVTWR